MNLYVACFADLSMGGGGATHARKLAEGLRDLGHTVTLIGKSSDNSDHSEFRDGMRIESRPVPVGIAWRVPTLVHGRVLARKLAEFEPPDAAIVLSHLHVRAACKAWPDVPVVFLVPVLLARCIVHLNDKQSLWEKLDLALIRHSEIRALRRADALTSQGDAMGDDIRALAGNWLRPVTLPPGVRDLAKLVNVPRAEFRANLQTSEGATVVLSVGHLDENKQFNTIIRAFHASRSERDILWICGHGPSRTSLEDLVDELGLENNVKFLGHRSDMANVYAAADFLVHAAQYEAFGNVFIEAMVSGLPVIGPQNVPGFNFSSLDEIITHGKHGFSYDPRDGDQPALVMAKLIGNAELRQQMGERAREHALKHFNGDHYARRVETLVIDTMEKKKQDM